MSCRYGCFLCQDEASELAKAYCCWGTNVSFSLAFFFYWYVAGKFDIKCDWDPTEILGFPFSANQLLTMLHLLRDAIVKVSMAVANAMIWSSQTAPLPALPCNFIDFLMFFFDICFIIFGQTFWFSNRDLKFFLKIYFGMLSKILFASFAFSFTSLFLATAKNSVTDYVNLRIHITLNSIIIVQENH